MKKINPYVYILYNLSLLTITNAKIWYFDMCKNEFGIKLDNGILKTFKFRIFKFELVNQINSVDIKFKNNHEMQEFIKDNLLYDNEFTYNECLTQPLFKKENKNENN